MGKVDAAYPLECPPPVHRPVLEPVHLLAGTAQVWRRFRRSRRHLRSDVCHFLVLHHARHHVSAASESGREGTKEHLEIRLPLPLQRTEDQSESASTNG